MLICLLVLAAGEQPTTVTFEPPIRIQAGGTPIDVTTGHAAPCVYDFDGDGVRDLLVGEFGDGEFKGEVHVKGEGAHSWANGRVRVYLNHGTDTRPSFDAWTYLEAGGATAAVPITCCLSFVPQFIDYDGDGVTDIISGSYPGDMYWWKGLGGTSYQAATRLLNSEGTVLLPWAPLPEKYWAKAGKKTHTISSITAELHDMDGDGDLDLWIGSRSDGAYTIENIGTRTAPIWSSQCNPMVDSNGEQIGGWSTGGSNIHWADWDADGLSDVVYGSEDGAVRFCRNSGEEHQPVLDPPVTLIPAMGYAPPPDHQTKADRSGSRCKVHVVDWDGDGLNDLLVGDYGSIARRIRTLTPEQVDMKAKLDTAISAVSMEAMPLWNADLPLNEAQKERLEGLDGRLDALYEASLEYEEYDYEAHGWVWLYRQQPVSIAAPVTGQTD